MLGELTKCLTLSESRKHNLPNLLLLQFNNSTEWKEIMDAALKSQIIDKIEQLPEDKLHEVLACLELILAKTSLERANSSKPTAEPVLLLIEASRSSSFYYDDSQEIYTLEDGTPIVWEMKPIRAISKRQLVRYLNELVALAKSMTPDVQTEILIPGDEGQHAWLKIYVPDELEEQISDLVSERVLDIFMETGYDIGAIVYEKSYLQPTTPATETLTPQS